MANGYRFSSHQIRAIQGELDAVDRAIEERAQSYENNRSNSSRNQQPETPATFYKPRGIRSYGGAGLDCLCMRRRQRLQETK